MLSRIHRPLATALAVCCVIAASAASAQEDTTRHAAAPPTSSTDPYPLDVCPVSGKKLGKMGRGGVVRTYEGREVRLCCASCAAKFDKDPQAVIKKLDELIIAAQKPGYPLEVCPVSGEKLGGMGQSVDYVYQNQLVRFCCPSCIDTFTKHPEEYMAKVRAAYATREERKDSTATARPDTSAGGHQEHGSHTDH